MSHLKKAIMKVPSYEPSWPQNTNKSSAADSKVLQLKGSPVKEPIFKAPLPSVNVTTALISQNNNTKAVHNKENTTGKDHDRTMDQGLEDSGYLSLHNSHIEDDDDHIYGRPNTFMNTSAETQDITSNPSPTKCQETRHAVSVVGIFTPIEIQKHDTSMSSTPADHHTDPNLPILKFEQAVCEELAKSFQKNKRYDWSIIPKLAEDYNLDRVIGGQMGVDFIDMFSSLLSRNMKFILAQILALLGDMDLISCKKVSKTWKQIIYEDTAALKRCKQAEKTLRDFERSQRRASGLTRDVAVSRVVLSSMQRVVTSSTSSQPSSSPVSRGTKGNGVSSLKSKTPDCIRFNQYVKAASSLKNHESLRHCKRCGSPATHVKEAQRATCTRANCQFDFCTCCQQAFHGSTPCKAVQLHFNTSKTSTILPGSARSKRNVRRL